MEDIIRLPDKWQDWHITEELGSGSYGSVYKAENDKGEIRAIKVIDIPKEKSEEEALYKEYRSIESVEAYFKSMVEDFEKESELLMSLKDSTNIVQVYDHHKEKQGIGWRYFICMECLQNFQDYSMEHDIDEEQAIRFALDICEALIQCEKLHIIHRDLKPDNILVDKDGTFKICDFGVARKLEGDISVYSLKGTFAFMAPEIYQGKKYNSQVDLYSLGMILYRLMNRNREPFIPIDKKFIYHKDKEEALTKRMEGEAIPAPVDATEEFANIILKACAYNPGDRYRSAADMKKDLEKLLKGMYRKSRLKPSQIKGLAACAAVILIVAAAAGIRFWRLEYGPARAVYDEVTKTLEIKGSGTVDKDCINKVAENDADTIRQETKALIIGENIKEIGDDCFRGFTALLKIKKDDGLEKIGAGAFCECDSLESFSFPDNVKEASPYVLQSCPKLSDIDFNHVDFIGESACEGCLTLESVVIPDNVKEIPTSCFNQCENLETVELGENTISLGQYAFSGCGKLAQLTGIEHISDFGYECLSYTALVDKSKADEHGFVIQGDHLLTYYGNEQTVIIPDEVNHIEDCVLENVETPEQINKIILNDHIKTIGIEAFLGCNNLDVVIPNETSIEYIGKDAFSGTKWMKEKKDDFVTINDVLIKYQGEKKEIEIPENINKIAAEAFARNTNIKSVKFNDHIVFVGENAFDSTDNLDSIIIPNPFVIEEMEGFNPFEGSLWYKKQEKDESGYLKIGNFSI